MLLTEYTTNCHSQGVMLVLSTILRTTKNRQCVALKCETENLSFRTANGDKRIAAPAKSRLSLKNRCRVRDPTFPKLVSQTILNKTARRGIKDLSVVLSWDFHSASCKRRTVSHLQLADESPFNQKAQCWSSAINALISIELVLQQKKRSDVAERRPEVSRLHLQQNEMKRIAKTTDPKVQT